MRTLSGRERLMRVFSQQETDRMPIWLWGVDPMFPSSNPTWATLYELVEKHELDIMRIFSLARIPQIPMSDHFLGESRNSLREFRIASCFLNYGGKQA